MKTVKRQEMHCSKEIKFVCERWPNLLELSSWRSPYGQGNGSRKKIHFINYDHYIKWKQNDKFYKRNIFCRVITWFLSEPSLRWYCLVLKTVFGIADCFTNRCSWSRLHGNQLCTDIHRSPRYWHIQHTGGISWSMLGIRLRLKIDHNLLGVAVCRDFTTMSNNKMWSRTVHSWVYIPTRWFYRHCYLAKLILYH